jgi:hypothetical protein
MVWVGEYHHPQKIIQKLKIGSKKSGKNIRKKKRKKMGMNLFEKKNGKKKS